MTGVEYRLGEAHGTVDGTTGLLPSLEGLRLNVLLVGADASEFATMIRNGEVYSIADLIAVVGDSDISGDFALELGDKPSLNGRLASRNLNVTSLLGKEQQETKAGDDKPKSRLIPDTALPVSLIRTSRWAVPWPRLR